MSLDMISRTITMTNRQLLITGGLDVGREWRGAGWGGGGGGGATFLTRFDEN